MHRAEKFVLHFNALHAANEDARGEVMTPNHRFPHLHETRIAVTSRVYKDQIFKFPYLWRKFLLEESTLKQKHVGF
jgi:hypothetical protein